MSKAQLSVVRPRAATPLDFGVVEEAIQSSSTENLARNIAFSRYILRNHFGVIEDELERWIVDGGQDEGVDIFYHDDADAIINICNCKTVSNFKKSQSNFPGSELSQIRTFVADFFSDPERLIKRVNPKLKTELRIALEAVQSRSYKLHIHLFSNQMTLAPHERNVIVDFLSQYGPTVQFSEHGLYELAHGLAVNSITRFQKKIKPIKFFISDTAPVRCFQMEVDLKEFSKFVQVNEKDASFDERLLHFNVRYSLGKENDINKGILRSLHENAREFILRNNGVTIVCRQVLGTPAGSNPLALLSPQIVNGGQTASMINIVANSTISPILSGSVNVKIIETSDRELIEKIAFSSNAQTRVLGRDLRANDIEQVKLSIALRRHGYFYRRKAGETASDSGMEIIESLRAGQLLLSYVAGEPTKCKTNSNDIFDDLYVVAFGMSPCPDTLVVAFKLHKEITGRRASKIGGLGNFVGAAISEDWIVEGHFHILFVLGALMRQHGCPMSDFVAASSMLSESIRIVEEYVLSNPNISAYRLFRSAHSKVALQRIIDSNSTDFGGQLFTPRQGKFDF